MQMRGVAIVAASFSALAVAAAPASAHRAATCPHNGTLNGVSVLIECGPAKASVTFGATHLALKNGKCLKSSANFSWAFGTIPAGPGIKRPPDSFQLIAGGGSTTMHDGTYSATVMVSRLGKNYIGDSVKLKLTRKESAGTFSGTVTWALGTKKVAVSGSFTC
ncbi:MAG TPA: hypothetical protein VGN06_13075 [Gaiellaceae bacterium]|jgi:hypothetical protein